MRSDLRTLAAIATAMALLLTAGVAAYAASAEAWVKVEFKFRVGGKTTTVFHDIPVAYAKDAPEYCARYIHEGEKGLAYVVQQGHPELANASFIGLNCVTESGKVKLAKRPTDRLPKVKPPPSPLANPAASKGNGPVTYQVDLVYEEIVDGVRPRKHIRLPMRAANARAAETMCGSPGNMLRLSSNIMQKNPYALGLTGSWMAGGGKCITGKDGYIEMTVATSSGRSN